MVGLNDAILKLVMENKVSTSEALARAVDKEDLRQSMKVAGVQG